MKVIKWLAALSGCLTALTLWGCGKQVTDKPGMEYVPQWTAFTVSGSDSYAQYNFSFTVSNDTLSGECIGEDGQYYEAADMKLTDETVWVLRRMNLEQLPDQKPAEPEGFQTDAAELSLTLTLPNGETVEKAVSNELSLELYDILLPYFKNNQ